MKYRIGTVSSEGNKRYRYFDNRAKALNYFGYCVRNLIKIASLAKQETTPKGQNYWSYEYLT